MFIGPFAWSDYGYPNNTMSLSNRSSSMNVNGTKAKREQLLNRSPKRERFIPNNLTMKWNKLAVPNANCSLGAVHMSRANPANRADLSHENLYFSTKYRFI